jgi:MULE transposase domain
LLSDGTFSTNALNLTLIVIVRITNTGRSFPISQSFARSEAAVSFDFIFECHRDFIFTDNIPLLRVVLSDQAPGMISSLPSHLSTTRLQFYEWHVSQNIKARLLKKGGYTKDLREQVVQQFWRYCKAGSTEEVTRQRFELTALLAQNDADYVLSTWVPKEQQFLRLYTKQYPNLGCHSNQRCESLHLSTKMILNPQLRLAEAVNRLNTTIRQKLRALAEEETKSGLKLSRTLNKRAFASLINTISTYAVELIAPEWEDTKDQVDRDILTSTSPCQCELLLRYGLPYRHHLQEAYRSGMPIPRSLCHPRWWIFGPTIRFSNWQPSINTITLPISPPRNQVTHSAQKLLDLRDSLQGEAKARVDQAILQANAQVMKVAQQAQSEAALPTELPEQVKKQGWRRDFKAHDKTTRRAMTAVEAMERDEQRAEKTPVSPTGPTVSLEDLIPPPSTAPAIVGGTRKGPRKHTTVYREAFGDSQEDPTAGIKRGRAGGIL